MSMSEILSPAMSKAARALLGWTQQDLATRANLAKRTVANFENGGAPQFSKTANKLHIAFEEAGLVFRVANTLSGELDGQSVGFKATLPHEGFRVVRPLQKPSTSQGHS